MKYTKISCIYRPPPRGDHKKCIDKLSEILLRRENFKREVWFIGDFNVDFLKRTDLNFKRFQSFMKTFGLSQLIRDATRPGINSGSCLDWIVTNCKFVHHACVTNIFLSDHFAVECIKKKKREVKHTVYRSMRDYRNYDKKALITLLNQKIDNVAYRDINDPNIMWTRLYNCINEILSVMCPLKRYRQRESQTPWISAEIYREMRYRDQLIVLYKVTKKRLYLTLAKQQRNKVNSMVESAKKLYISSILENTSSNPKKFWRHINQLLKGNSSVNNQVIFHDQTSNEEIEKGEEANFLNDFFCNISTRLGFEHNDNIDYNEEYLSIYQNIQNGFR